MTQNFSDAPLTVDGVTVKPTWKWSSTYRARVADELQRTTKSDLDLMQAESRYIAWYAQEHGLTLDAARVRVKGETT